MINNFRKALVIAVMGLMGLMLASSATAASKAKTRQVLENLQTAYRSESNAQAHYLAFAKQAEKEGYGEVASLFRAAARAEEIELRNNAAVIKKMGEEPQLATIETVGDKSTRENLVEAATRWDVWESTDLYPRFIKQAKSADNADAATFFFYAQQAANQQGALFHKALANLEEMKGASHTYYVCSVCGYTAETPRAKNCDTCASPAEKYEAVN